MRRGIRRPSLRDGIRAELLRLRVGASIGVLAALAIVASAASSLSTALLVGALRPDPLEAAVVAVHRGSAASVAIALAVAVLVGADHRHGTAALAWMQLGGRRRLVVVGVVQVALAAMLGVLAGGAALAVVAALTGTELDRVPWVLAVHVALMALWSTWLVCIVTLTGSTLATLACGLAVPLVVEPAVAGALAAGGAAGVERLLPTTALRTIGELAAVGERVVLAPGSPDDAWIAACAVAGWTALLVGLAWRRASCAP